MRLGSGRFASVTVTPRTTWSFALISDGEGNSTTVEITHGGNPREVFDSVAGMLSALALENIQDESQVEGFLGLNQVKLRLDRVSATAVSAIRTAVSQLQALRDGVSLREHLGGPSVESVPLYANINRGLFATDRSPESFGRMADRAAEAGFSTFKCAPFDEVHPPSSPDRILDEAAIGLARVAAVREAIGPDARLLVDCHSRFERDTAPIIVDELAKLNVGWFEEPVQPTADADDLGDIARWSPIPVAGGESGYGTDLFTQLLDSEAISVIMPDIKYCGGVAEAVSAGRSAVGRSKGFSIHSPSGPISLLASAHATAAVVGAMPLEHAVYEADWRADLILPAERIEAGRIWLTNAPGLGAEMDLDLVRRFGSVWEP